MMRSAALIRSASVFAASALALTACGEGDGGDDSGAAGAEGDQTDLLIVAPTDVYGDLARQVVGDTAEIEALVESPAIDPHSYEATPQDRLMVEEADVVIANGGGYDPYMNQLAESAEIEDGIYQVLDGENWHSHEWEGSYENEHIWYDLAEMRAFVEDFGEYVGELAPENETVYQENAEALAAEIQALHERAEAIDAEGLEYFATEPVSQFLLQDAGFEDLTEEEFLAAVEHGDDVSPRLYQESLEIVGPDGGAELLAYNPQTETHQSQQIREAAEENDLPVLEFSETFPDDVDDFLIWMEQNISQIEETAESIRG